MVGPGVTKFIGNVATNRGGAVDITNDGSNADRTFIVDGPLCAQDNQVTGVTSTDRGGFVYLGVGKSNSLVFNDPSTANIANNMPDDIYAATPAAPYTTSVSSSDIGIWPPGPSYTIGGPVSSARLVNGNITFGGCPTGSSWNAEECQCTVS